MKEVRPLPAVRLKIFLKSIDASLSVILFSQIR